MTRTYSLISILFFGLDQKPPIPDVEHKPHRIVLAGDAPSPVRPPDGCRFHTRCPFVLDRCREEEPQLEDVGGGHKSACHRKHEVERLVRDR